ncbi:glycosyltransferase family 2 protein [Dethiosulfatarculus sandiegensis]|uniref:glycosyltransferase family 2 protein n=1 Tax=Dethiosulfatarculus sandiegensis TaxID=1429043 RepID=UPI0012E2A06A|nr:hypothetical protein [Dethiosulfatarculus sandiegensis]
MPSPYLSVVVTSRNDDHGSRLKERTQIFIHALLAQAKRHKLPTELIMVEWNPPADRPGLADIFDWSALSQYSSVRIITVGNEVHRRYTNHDKLPLYQMIAKNVGIRRAKGEFVLATNIDVIFPDEVFEYFASASLSPGHMYRCDRWDIDSSIPMSADLNKLLAYCSKNVIRHCERYQTKMLKSGESIYIVSPQELAQNPYYKKNLRLHTNACGDFTLLHKNDWFKLRAYPEYDMFSMHLDSLFCYNSHYNGIVEHAFQPPLVIFHIDHESGWKPEKDRSNGLYQKLSQKQIPFISNQQAEAAIRQITETKKAPLVNPPDWGLAQLDLPEKEIVVSADMAEEKPRASRQAVKSSDAPYLSLVVASRNDDHGGGLNDRTQIFLNWLAYQCNQFKLNTELVFVEWNPPEETQSLAEVLDWPQDSEYFQSRLIQVPPRLHNRLESHDKIRFYQMIAKNVGIRRAKGEFILATNLDLIFSDELMAFLAKRKLNKAFFYRMDRHDLIDRELPDFQNSKQLMEYCQSRVHRMHQQENRPLHTNACGDFTLLAKEHWHTLMGYPELPLWSIYLDGIFVFMSHTAGLKQVVLQDPMRIYHIEHSMGWALDKEPAKHLPSLDFEKDYVPWCRAMVERNQAITPNKKDWGFGGENLPEYTPGHLSASPKAHASKHNQKTTQAEKPLSPAQLTTQNIQEQEDKTASPDTISDFTIFTIPKAFTGHTAVIQNNAINSWLHLNPRPKIILFGNEKGVAEIAHKYGLIHEPDVKCNEYGTPLINEIFGRAEELVKGKHLAFVNTDVIIMDDFITAANRAAALFSKYLLIGRRWDFSLNKVLDFSQADWQKTLRNQLKKSGELHETTGIDYFIFSKGLWPMIPPFAVGRTAWDNWLVAEPLDLGLPVVDCSEVITAIHQSHDYLHVKGGRNEVWNGREAARNREMAGMKVIYGTTSEASHVMLDNKICLSDDVNGRPPRAGQKVIKLLSTATDMINRNEALEGLRSLDQAKEIIDQNIRFKINDFYYVRAVALFNLGRYSEAEQEAKTEISQQPNHHGSLDIIRRIEQIKSNGQS